MQPSYVIADSRKHNAYALDLNKRQIMYLHPVLAFLIKNHQQDGKNHPRVHQPGSQDIQDDNPLAYYKQEEIDYYDRKFSILKSNGYFGPAAQNIDFTRRITPEQLRQGLANNRRMVLEVTDRCNLRCAYCGYGDFYCDFDARENINLDPVLPKTLLSYMQNHWNSSDNVSNVEEIYLSFYGGEPLLNFNFILQMIAYCKSLYLEKNRFCFTMTTNGVLLDRFLDVLVKENFYLTVSLDGNEEHNSYRTFSQGSSSHAQVMRNLLLCKQKYPDFFRDRVNINAVLHNRNSVSEIVEFFKSNFDKVPKILCLSPMGIRPERQKDFLQTYQYIQDSVGAASNCRELESELFTQLPHTQALNIFIHEYCDFCHKNYTQTAYSPTHQTRLPTATCLPFSHKIFLTVKGKLMPCEKIGFQYGLGSVTPGKVNIDFEAIAQKYNEWYAKFPGQCKKCYNQKTCGKCLFFTPLENAQPVCDEFMTADDCTKSFTYVMDFLEENPDLYNRVLVGGKDAAHA